MGHVPIPPLSSPSRVLTCILQGSYAGARAAHMRILYPDLVFGAIASSGTPTSPFTLPSPLLPFPFPTPTD